jgi:sigma-B regulation protein RsbU (phosphoserine phosphatase)
VIPKSRSLERFRRDGITECMDMNQEMFGPERLLVFINDTREFPISEVLTRLEQHMRLWLGSDKFEDDISVLPMEMSAGT